MDRPADWNCPNVDCQNHTRLVFGSKATCPKCGAEPDPFGEAPPAAMPSPRGSVMGGWTRLSDTGAMGGGGAPERQGDWQCPDPSCFNHTRMVFGSKANCPKCGSERPSFQAPPMGGRPSFGGAKGVGKGMPCGGGFGFGVIAPSFAPSFGGGGGGERAEDWSCPNTDCMNHTKMVFGRHDSCPKCGTARNAKQAGDWACPNGACVNSRNTVFASKSNCPKCGSPRPGAMVSSGSFGKGGFAPRPRSVPYAAPQQFIMPRAMPPMMMHHYAAPVLNTGNPGDWACPSLDCQNHTRGVFAKNDMCPKCGAAKPLPIMFGGGKGGGNNPGDWQCPNVDCQNHRNRVFAKNDSCPKCGELRPPLGAAPIGLSGNPGDWQCPNVECQNHRNRVFAKNDSCPKCGEIKPSPEELGRSGDWQCPNTECQNHRNNVFAKHMVCPKCGTEKDADFGEAVQLS